MKVDRPPLVAEWSFVVVAQSVFDPLPVELVAAVDALGVDTQQDVDAVAGPLGNLGGIDAGVQPGGQAGVAQVVGPPGEG